MSKTLVNIRDEVYEVLRTDNIDSNVDQWVLDALAMINSFNNYSWLRKEGTITLADGTDTYDLPSDYYKLYDENALIYNNSSEVELVHEDYFRGQNTAQSDTGIPNVAYFNGMNATTLLEQLTLYPVPSSDEDGNTILFPYLRKITVNGDGNIIMPEQYLWGIKNLAVVIGGAQYQMAPDILDQCSELAKVWENQMNKDESDKRNAYKRGNNMRPKRETMARYWK